MYLHFTGTHVCTTVHFITVYNMCALMPASVSKIHSILQYRIGDLHASIDPTTLGTYDPSIYICVHIHTTSTAALKI